MAKALETWAPEVIEAALGADAQDVLPEAVRLINLHVRLPRYHVAMLEHFAERDHTVWQARMRAFMVDRRLRGRAGGPDADAPQLPCR